MDKTLLKMKLMKPKIGSDDEEINVTEMLEKEQREKDGKKRIH